MTNGMPGTRPLIVAVAGRKGGSGKTTTAVLGVWKWAHAHI